MMEIGSKAPEVLGHDENGNEVRLSQFKGKVYREKQFAFPPYCRCRPDLGATIWCLGREKHVRTQVFWHLPHHVYYQRRGCYYAHYAAQRN